MKSTVSPLKTCAGGVTTKTSINALGKFDSEHVGRIVPERPYTATPAHLGAQIAVRRGRSLAARSGPQAKSKDELAACELVFQ